MRQDLNGIWMFRRDEERSWRQAIVPSPCQAQFPELLGSDGVFWYSRDFTIPRDWERKVIRICFGAVDYYAAIWINDKYVGSHEGGYTPFSLEIQDTVRADKVNKVLVKVVDGVGDYQEREIPRGKQSWYAKVSGIWQGVYLESRGRPYIRCAKATPSLKEGVVSLHISIAYPPTRPDGNIFLDISIISGEEIVGREEIPLEVGKKDYRVDLRIPNPIPWSPKNPFLYRFEISVRRGKDVVDLFSDWFGMRDIEVRDGLIILNGEPIYVMGALDQDFYPNTIYTPPSDEFLRDQFEKAKAMGINMLRCHMKIPDPRYLYWTDRYGILVWEEIPNWEELTDRAKVRVKRTLEEMIDRDYNHPSVVIWGIANEGWGLNLSLEDHRKWLREIFQYAKELDPSRLVVDNSACGGNFHLETDIEDFHVYFSMPDHWEEFKRWIKEFAGRPSWTFSPYGDGRRSGNEPLLLSEFGNWGIPLLSTLRDFYGGDPWWFSTGQGNTRPEGVDERFKAQRLDRIFGSLDELARATQRHQFEALKWQICEIRKQGTIKGYVITEFTDLHWESNGLLDMLRNGKIYFEDLKSLQADDLLIPTWTSLSYWGGERIALSLSLSHFSSHDLRDAKVLWDFGSEISGSMDRIPPVACGDVVELGEISFELPDPEEKSSYRLRFRLTSNDKTISENWVDLFLFPSSWRRGSSCYRLSIWDPKGIFPEEIPHILRDMGYEVVEDLESADIAVFPSLDGGIASWISEGGKGLWINVGGSQPSISIPIRVIGREEGGRWGDWCSSFIWIYGDDIGLRSHKSGILGFESVSIIPSHVFLGDLDFSDVISGIFVGWLGSPAAVTLRMFLGEGRLLATTFKLYEALGKDPVTTVMFQDYIGYLSSPSFSAGMKWP